MNPSDLSGFNPRVQEQLAQLSLDASSTSSQSSQQANPRDPRQPRQPRHNSYTTHIHPRNTFHPRPNQDYYATMSGPSMPPGLDAFPPLGSERIFQRDMQAQPPYQNSAIPAQPVQPAQPTQPFAVSSAAQDFFSRARGHGRGRAGQVRGQQHQQSDRKYQAPNQSHNYGPTNNFSRPASNRMQPLTNFGGQRNFVPREQQNFWRQKSMLQADYLNFLVGKSVTNSLSQEELKIKHTFRKRLEKIAQDLMTRCLPDEYDRETTELKLESYGSLSNSFGTTGCDVDLLLLIRRTGEGYTDIPWEFQHRLAKAILDENIGAKLLTNTHVPIIQVCEIPDTELLTNLRHRQIKMQQEAEDLERIGAVDNEHGFEGLPVLSAGEERQATAALQLLDHTANDVPLPDSPVNENTKLEFVGNLGIQCDINFSKRVAMFNTKLLWQYGQFDPRVRPIILFIKNWAKARDINTPYQGTLSSYGWVLLGLHYLMNVANPPVIPNLQQAARSNAWSTSSEIVENFEGYDVAFEQDKARIEQIKAGMLRNKESMGGLLQGFFRYYAQNSGFRWTQDVISIRTEGGLLLKQFKGWTALKRSEDRQHVRHRYLLAIEDPFETEHNIARTVGHNGVVAIRDEFRRAWEIIENIQRGQAGQDSWVWLSREKSQSGSGLDLISKAEKRGDLLRKDYDSPKEKLAEMRRLAEEREESAKKDNLQSDLQVKDEWSHNGMSIEEECLDNPIDLMEGTSQLIHNLHHQDEKVLRMRARTTSRQRVHCEDDIDDWEDEQADQIPTDANNQIANFDSSDSIQPVTDGYQNAENNEYEEAELSTDQDTEPQSYADNIHQSPDPELSPKNSAAFSPTSSKKVRFADNQEQSEEIDTKTKPKKVGPIIAWSKDSKAGRWLLNRDKQIRAGTYKPITYGERAILSATFRYDPDMTQEELDLKNEILETHYKDELHPRISQSHEEALNNATNPATEHSTSSKVETIERDLPTKRPSEEELLKDWPVTGSIWWSDLTSAGRWLLWRDRKISQGIWVEKKTNSQDVGTKLSNLYPYHGKKTFANVERMNTELDTFFLDIEYPRSEMGRETRSACTAAMQNAIEKVRENRQLEARQPQLNEIYAELNSKQSSLYNKSDENAEKTNDLVESNSQQSVSHYQTRWTESTDTGRWLQRRDDKIADGVWRDKVSENSIFSHINKLFPFDSNRSAQQQEKLNEELEIFCSDFVLPGHYSYSNSDQELAYEAILKIVERRKDRDEPKRADVLLDLFKHQEKKKQPAPTYLQDKDFKQENTIDRQAQAIQNLSLNLKTATNNTTDFIRRQRLAFYGQQQKPAAVVGVEDCAEDNTDDSLSKDSGAEGSWNQPLSFSCHSPSPQAVYQLTDQYQLLGTISTETQALCNQHDPASTNESELIPNTLLPNTWREEFHARRDENPRIMPIPRTLDFPFDPRQMTDIETIKAGGNGCARGGLEFTMESDLHSWGGGGAMAQKSNKRSFQDGDKTPGRVSDGGDPILMQELPNLSDIGA